MPVATNTTNYAQGGYTGNGNSLDIRIDRTCYFPAPRGVRSRWEDMTDVEQDRWMVEAKMHSHCACGNPRFHLVVTC